ncbi:MAG: glycosyltransferase family 2 protein [Cyclobacterium sp.]|uniref:glycosyltransferase family 2 protein n=1 Tax=unclassified Cyclobacterium TaxID=2615055 RepID=UPI0013D6D233|nr:glycosyltransferase family 2 protein [Cyclobacterium sp. SYSU L10401]
MISVIILTKNEEKDLPICLDSLKWSDDIHILDSGSEDNTIEIAKNHGASISFNPFVSFGEQRNFALDNIKTKYEWILFLDSDEKVTPAFENAIKKSISIADRQVAGFYCCCKMMLEGKWLKRCDNFPKWQFRLLCRGRARFTDFGHGQKEDTVHGRIEYIKEPYLHYGFSKGWAQWIERHNKYSSQEALYRKKHCPPFKNIFTSQESLRNPALKSWLSKVPGWPLLRFFQAYLVNFGFIEGVPGLIYCINMAYYEFLIQIKMREL